MAKTIRAVSHEDQLSLVEHLDELRTRLLVSLFAFLFFFAICFWQNNAIINIVNGPFEKATSGQTQRGTLAKTASFQRKLADLATAQAAFSTAVANEEGISAGLKKQAESISKLAAQVSSSVPSSKREPVTLGVAEPFTQTFKVAGYAAILLSLPIILWQLYAFILPAFSPKERRVALPLMSMVPVLFIAGAVFAYFVVLPSAIKVLQNFNSDNFDILVQAKDLYKFTILTCVAMGALFQVPIGILLLTRMEIVSVQQLRSNRRYAILVIAVLAMLLPGTDPVTMILSMLPLLFLFEGSILIAGLMDRRARKHAAAEGDTEGLLDDTDEDDD
jgi:sec-independent protein translocase protein TatC